MDKKHKIPKVTKPYLKGDMIDRTTLPGAVKFFFGTVVMAILFLVSGVMMNFGQQWISILANTVIMLAAYLFFQQMGLSAGADAVNQGEIMHARQEKGRPVAEWERSMCFHPLKGLVSALIGSIPFFVCALVLAVIAQRQMTNLGALPNWLSGFEAREEIGGALAYYHETGSMSLEGVLRLIVRMATMPCVNMIGAANKDGLLILERISPILMLLPALCYGLGYMGGVSVRSTIHTNIALGKKKAKRKQAKERRARRSQTHRGPEQLN